MLTTDDLLLTRAQRDLYRELDGDDLEGFAERLAARVVILVRHRCVHGRESRTTLAMAERVHQLITDEPRGEETRAALWTLVEWLTRWPWGAAAYGAIDRLVVAGAILDELARQPE